MLGTGQLRVRNLWVSLTEDIEFGAICFCFPQKNHFERQKWKSGCASLGSVSFFSDVELVETRWMMFRLQVLVSDTVR